MTRNRPELHTSLEQLPCGCYRYCDSCSDSAPCEDDIVGFARALQEHFGEAWFDSERWDATELSSLSLAQT
jgi:hypothetical protein